MLYRVHEEIYVLDTNERIPAGTVGVLKLSEESIEGLLAKGRISEIAAPPLVLVPKLRAVAKKLAEVGIKDVHDLVDADLAGVAEELDTTVEVLEKVKDTAMEVAVPGEDYDPFVRQGVYRQVVYNEPMDEDDARIDSV